MKKIITISMVIIAVIGITLLAQTNKQSDPYDKQLREWEQLAEAGDTVAMHRLIEFYDENSMEYVEVEAIIDCDGNEVPAEEIERQNEENRKKAEFSKEYAERLDYWLEKGLSIGDPIALYTKGMRLYYTDEKNAIGYLSKAADSGNGQAALFCGSACLNQGNGDDAFKYLSIAYKRGVPSAGWHLAMCYTGGIGTEVDDAKAYDCMRHAAILDYPEAVSEMRRVEPLNQIWQQKADSLEIDFPDFKILR